MFYFKYHSFEIIVFIFVLLLIFNLEKYCLIWYKSRNIQTVQNEDQNNLSH